jgi:hypothetical protein
MGILTLVGFVVGIFSGLEDDPGWKISRVGR